MNTTNDDPQGRPERRVSLHTPGPWFVRYCDDDNFMCMTAISAVPVPERNVDRYDDRDLEEMVAIVYHQSYPFVRPEDVDGAQANARLIAAAPELLKVLRTVAQALEWHAHGRCRGLDDEGPLSSSDAVALAEAAISRAIGA